MKIRLRCTPRVKTRLLKAKRGFFFYQDTMAKSPKRIPTIPNDQVSSIMMTSPTYVNATVTLTSGSSRFNFTTPAKRMKVDVYTCAAPRRPYLDPEFRNRIGKVRSPLKTRTNLGPGRNPTVEIPVSARTYYRSHVSTPVGSPGASGGNKDGIVASEQGSSGTFTTCSYGFTGSKHIENSAPSNNFGQAQMSTISNENVENEDPVRREENHPSESRDEDSESNTTDGEDLDSTLGLVQKSVTDTAEEDEFGDCTDTDSASENEYRSNEYYNSPKLVVSINEVSGENTPGTEKSTPRLTVSMNFEEEDEFENRYVRPEYRRRAEDLSKKIGTSRDPFYGGRQKVEGSHGAQGGDQGLGPERVVESLNGSSQKSIYKSATSGMVSVSTTATEGKPLLGNYLLLESSNLTSQWNLTYGSETSGTPLEFPKSLPGPDKNRVWLWLNHPLANRRRRSYHDSDQED